MPRDWKREELVLKAKARTAFKSLMGIEPTLAAPTPRYGPHYTAEEALMAYQAAQAELAAFLDDRRANDG